jgi:flagellar biosynthesis protein FlhB
VCRTKVADKSEAPTPKRLRDARLRGQVAKSPLLITGALTGVLGLFVRAIDPASWGVLMEPARSVAQGGSFDAAQASLGALVLQSGITVLAPFLSIVVLVAMTMNVAQTGPLYAPKAFEARGGSLLRFTSPEAWVSLLRTLLVLAVLLAIVVLTVREMLHGLGTLTMRPAAFTFTTLITVLETLLERCTLAMLGLGIVDLLHRRNALKASLRMSKEEILREQKSSEGDPEARVERQRRGRDLGGDPLEALLTCALIIWSRERFLVGLAYARDVDEGAPRIVVRGSGQVAVTLRQFAQHQGLHALEDDALAKRLFGLDEVPEDAFEGIARALQEAWAAEPSTRAPL